MEQTPLRHQTLEILVLLFKNLFFSLIALLCDWCVCVCVCVCACESVCMCAYVCIHIVCVEF